MPIMVIRLNKSRTNPNLVRKQIVVTREGSTFPTTVWVRPGDAIVGGQLDLFEQPPAKEPAERDKQIAQAINRATPENRAKVAAFVAGADVSKQLPRSPEEAYKFTPSARNLGTIGNLNVGVVEDYTSVIPKKISLVPKDKILEAQRPSWIPEVEESYVRRQSGRLPFVRLDTDEYLMQLAGEPYGKERYALANLDVLAATNDFYLKKIKVADAIKIKTEQDKYKAEARQKLHELQALQEESIPENKRSRWKANIDYYQKVINGKIKAKTFTIPLRVIGDNSATRTQMSLLSYVGRGSLASWEDSLREYNQKLSDMEIQQEDLMSVYYKGKETSYGDANTKKDLLDTYGVLVKRQNGDEITKTEICEIRDALVDIYAIYGDRSLMARKFGLKISHSGKRLMHARQALGIFIPYYRAIGVTAQLGDTHMGFTLSHEWAHFMDNYLGGRKYNYSSDEFGSLSNDIARHFRNNQQKRQTSPYQLRTCECFARAFEEYFSIKTGGWDELREYSSKQGNYVDSKLFEKEVMPLIDTFFKQNDSLLKAIRKSIWNQQ